MTRTDASAWNTLLSDRHVEADPVTVEKLQASKIDPNDDSEFGFVTWWKFLTNNDITPRVPLILALSAAGLQAGHHPYWGIETWFDELRQAKIPASTDLIIKMNKAKIWATDPHHKGESFSQWISQTEPSVKGIHLILAAKNEGVSATEFEDWLASPEGETATATLTSADLYAAGSQAASVALNFVTIAQLSHILSRLADNPRFFASGNFATPRELVRIVDEAVATYTLHILNAQGTLPSREGVTQETCFVGPAMRDNPFLNYIPCRLSLIGTLLNTTIRPDVCLISVSPPRNGRVSLGIETNIVPAAIEATRANGGLVIAQVNSHMPYTFGDSEIDCTLIDYALEADETLMSVRRSDTYNGVYDAIGKNIARLVPDHATLQLGIGSIPDAVLDNIKTQKDLSVWTEMFSDGVLDLHNKGKLNPDNFIAASFVIGSEDLYEWLNLNTGVRMYRTEVINDPGRISARGNMVSVNAALQVDLYAQANASRVKGRIYSGFGGSTDFIVGSLHSPGGQAFIALPSWHASSNESTIVPILTSPVTSFQHTAIVTEIGIARVLGVPAYMQAQRIVNNAAHPNARDRLNEAAKEFRIF
ncbi:MAG: acetyl-CoA hydrolase/transferase C-terminal domain-containing protein [Actinomycetes bacterium]